MAQSETKKNIIIFSIALLIAFVYWRIYVFLFFNQGNFPLLRAITGLRIHHYHYGIIFVLIAAIMFVLDKINKFSVILIGFGLGTILDSFISRLLPSTTRAQELANYNLAFISTILLFSIIIVFGIIYYISNYINKQKKNDS